MTSITKEQLESILEKKLEQKLAPIKKSFEELHKLVVFTSGQYDALLSKVTSCEKENSTLKDENKILKSALGSLETSLKSLLKANNEQEQYSRRECIEIRGVPERAGESTNHLVKEVGRALGVEVTDNDISVSHRLPPSKAYKTKKPVGPPPIIRDFKIRDATVSRTRWLIMDWDKNAGVCSGKSKVKIPVAKQDDAAAKRSLSV